jgi:hypothetical protein
VLAYESDVLEYGDLFDGSAVVEAKTAELAAGAEAEMAMVEKLGGMVPAESGYVTRCGLARRTHPASRGSRLRGVRAGRCGQSSLPSAGPFTRRPPSRTFDSSHPL